MPRQRITTVEKSAAIILPQDMLNQMGINIGDEVEVSIVDRTLILRPLDEVKRARKIDAATKTLFQRRKSAYERLAE
jgi:antitoxin component of MazEF toxin-antitoxin module